MQTVQWVGVGLSNALIRTVVHFFPSAGNVTAPYPCHCTLSVFGPGLPRRSVVLEGARLSQPDGVKLEAAFPSLAEGLAVPFGLAIELSSQQSRIDLSTSSCMVELVSAGPSVMYAPRMTSPEMCYVPRSYPAFRDSFTFSSLAIVNSTEDTFRPVVSAGLYAEGIAGEMTSDLELGDVYFKDTPATECPWGLSRMRDVSAAQEIPAGVSLFIIHRDVASKRPVSIVPL